AGLSTADGAGGAPTVGQPGSSSLEAWLKKGGHDDDEALSEEEEKEEVVGEEGDEVALVTLPSEPPEASPNDSEGGEVRGRQMGSGAWAGTGAGVGAKARAMGHPARVAAPHVGKGQGSSTRGAFEPVRAEGPGTDNPGANAQSPQPYPGAGVQRRRGRGEGVPRISQAGSGSYPGKDVCALKLGPAGRGDNTAAAPSAALLLPSSFLPSVAVHGGAGEGGDTGG
ncbi:unnamed protein product, partial [Discosporangium mesarthrocarpum]